MAVSDGVKLEVISGMMNVTKYVQVVQKKMVPGAEQFFPARTLFWYFHDGNAPCH